MKEFWTGALIVALGVLLFFGLPSKKQVVLTIAPASSMTNPAPAPPTGPGSRPAALVAMASPAKNSSASAPPAEIASRASSPGTIATNAPAAVSPPTLMENMRAVIRLYGSTFGGNPVGTNPEITAALAGANPKQINFIPADAGLRIDEKGELVDSWGTPFFFHQESGSETEIRSAGPDRRLWTADDLVAK